MRAVIQRVTAASVVIAGAIKGADPGETAVFQAVGYYWHFVDFMWVGLFSALFLLS